MTKEQLKRYYEAKARMKGAVKEYRQRVSKPNTIFEQVMYKNREQCEQLLSLLDKADISYKRYVK